MSNLTNDERWNLNHGLPQGAGPLTVAEYLAKNSLEPGVRKEAAALAKRLRSGKIGKNS